MWSAIICREVPPTPWSAMRSSAASRMRSCAAVRGVDPSRTRVEGSTVATSSAYAVDSEEVYAKDGQPQHRQPRVRGELEPAGRPTYLHEVPDDEPALDEAEYDDGYGDRPGRVGGLGLRRHVHHLIT